MGGEIVQRRRSLGGVMFCLAGAALIGFVTGRPLAEAAGVVTPTSGAEPLSHLRGEEGWIYATMFLVALFALGLLRLLLRLGLDTAVLLRQVQSRPSGAVAVLLIVGGVLCVGAAVALQWHASSSGAAVTLSAPMPKGVPGIPRIEVSGGTFVTQNRVSLMVPVTTVIVLLVGAILIALGIWSSIPARPVQPTAIPAEHVSTRTTAPPGSDTGFTSIK